MQEISCAKNRGSVVLLNRLPSESAQQQQQQPLLVQLTLCRVDEEYRDHI
jgi:hypothetical protein